MGRNRIETLVQIGFVDKNPLVPTSPVFSLELCEYVVNVYLDEDYSYSNAEVCTIRVNLYQIGYGAQLASRIG